MEKDMICVIYDDDSISADPDDKVLEEVIKSIGIEKGNNVILLNYGMEVKLVSSRVSELKILVPRNLLLLKLV